MRSNNKKIKASVNYCNLWNNPKEHFHQVITSTWYKNISLIMATILNSTFEFYKDKDIYPTCLPITCGSVSSPMGLGSDSIPVKINLFDEETYLADSMQFHLEYILRQGFLGAYYIMPSFRGENPDSRHLNQFFHSEAEILGNLEDIITLVELYIKHISKGIYKNNKENILEHTESIEHIKSVTSPEFTFPRITFDDSIDLLGDDKKYFVKVKNVGLSITNFGERELIKRFNGPVWLTNFPRLTVPFYQAVDPSNIKNSLTADLLMGIGETVGCGQRHRLHDQLHNSLKLCQIDPKKYDWYLELKKCYPLLTSGFGMGIERFILWILNHDDIRDIALINRTKGGKLYV